MIGQVLCVYMSYICNLWEVFVLVSQLLAGVTVSNLPEGTQAMGKGANIPHSTYWPSNWGIHAPDRPSVSVAERDDCSAPLLFWFGSDKHTLSPAAWSPDHNSPNTEERRGRKWGWVSGGERGK